MRIRFPWLEIGVVFVGLLVAELGTRAAVSAQLLASPDPLLWHRREVYTKLEQIQALEQNDAIEVLFVGSSLAYMSVNPAIFDSTYERVSGHTILSYNAGLAALPVSMVDFFVERVFTDHISPKTIIYLVSPRDFNVNNPTNQVLTEEVLSSAYGQALQDSGLQSILTRFLLENSMLFRYRNMISVTFLNGFRVPEELPSSYNDPQFDARGFSAGYNRLTSRLSVTENAVPRDKQAAISLREFDPSGENTVALASLIAFCRERKIQLVLVNVPLTEYFVASFERPSDDYRLYVDTVATLLDEHDVPWWDMNQPPFKQLFSDNDFHDVFHLNEVGARNLSQILGELYAQSIP